MVGRLPESLDQTKYWHSSFENADLQLIFARSASSVTPSEKEVQLTPVHYALFTKPKMNSVRYR